MEAVAKIHPVKLTGLLLIGVLIASSWLVFPYFVQGRQLLSDVGDNSRAIKGNSVSRYLTRSLAATADLKLTATYASDEFFQFVDRAAIVGSLRPDLNLIFIVNETIHRGELPAGIPDVVLHVDGRQYRPAMAEGPAIADHHRVSIYSFPKRDDAGNLIAIDTAGKMRLEVISGYLEAELPLSFSGTWKAPYAVPEQLRSGSGLSWIAVFALGAGLLSSVLTPCLLQLVVVFGSVIAAFSTVPGQAAANVGQAVPVVRSKIMPVAIAFVLGFIILYGLSGAVIGGLGHRAQLLFAEQARTVAVVAGALVIALGLWVGFRSARNLSCKIPDRTALRSLSRQDIAGTMIASMAYALGCTACFGGAIVGTLLVYVGAIGSAVIGAGIMLSFAAGVAIPFLLAAFYLSKIDSVVAFLAQNWRSLNVASMVVIVVFGLILMTDNFHTVSDMIYPYLGLN
jgi:cytochrome c-type biogenesis protein